VADLDRREMARLINSKGVKITRGDLWLALQCIPPAGEFATRAGAGPYAQVLLLSILANRECESCNHGDNGGGNPCSCPVPCGARYCQHPVEDGEHDTAAPHACCEHADSPGPPSDPELAAMAALLPALPLVSGLGLDARKRVMDWAKHRACDGLPPF
jgi:hypothetical protein